MAKKKDKKRKKSKAQKPDIEVSISTGFDYLISVNETTELDEQGYVVLKEKEKWKNPLPGLYNSILYSRFDGRRIPKADDGIKNPDENISTDALKDYYKRCHIAEYVHLDTIERGKNRVTTNRIKFEFGDMMSGYDRINLDDNGENEVIRKLTYAEMNKKSFINRINNTLRYINYFIEYFDDDDELMSIYFQLMFQIMNRNIELDPETFIENVYAYFSTDSMREKIIRMVEYNTNETLIKKTDKIYDESIQLTLEHLKAIMAVSCIHKFVIPIVGHYYNMKSRLLEKIAMTDKDLYYYVFSAFIPVFDDYYDISLYNKLYHTSTTRVKKTANQESPMWGRRLRFGVTPTSFSNHLMRDFLIDISQKAVFSKSAIIFIHVCFDKSIRNELIQPDKYEFTEMRMEASDSVNEVLSRFDRWQTDKTFHSQKDRIRAFVSIRDSIEYMGDMVGLDFRRMRSKDPKDIKKTKELREEFEYYRQNIVQPMDDSQLYIIRLYYSSILGCSDDAIMVETTDIIKLIMIMKRDFASRNYNYLRFFISSTLVSTADKGYKKLKVQKLFNNHPCWDDFISQYPDIKALNLDRLFNDIKPIISCPVKVVDYEYTEYRDQILTPVDISVVDELIRLLMSL